MIFMDLPTQTILIFYGMVLRNTIQHSTLKSLWESKKMKVNKVSQWSQINEDYLLKTKQHQELLLNNYYEHTKVKISVSDKPNCTPDNFKSHVAMGFEIKT